jgi:four helix bundle protein
MQDFRNLKVRTKAHETALHAYAVTADFPAAEKYGLTSQIRRAASSIGANIAECCGRGTNPELVRFLLIAIGSASELEYHLLLAHDLQFIGKESYGEMNSRVVEVKSMLGSLIARMRERTR